MFRLFIHNRFSELDVDASFPFTRRTSEVTLYLVQSFQQRYFEDTFQIVSLKMFSRFSERSQLSGIVSRELLN